MKNLLLRFFVSRGGSILTPFIAIGVASVVSKLAAIDPNLAGSLDQSQITAFVVAFLLSAVNYYTNVKQADGIKSIQAIVDTDVDGFAGPVTYREVRKAIPINKA